jgi:hypothetical protein
VRIPFRSRPEIGRREAERLLDGDETVNPALAGVADLLAAAAGPPLPHETRGERAAVDRFRQAYVAAARARSRRRSRRLAVAVSAAAVVAVLGGTAYAAHSGRLPDPLQRTAHDLLSPVGVPAPDQPAPSRSPSHGPSPSPAPSSRTGSAAADHGSVGPSAGASTLRGLCQLWRAAEQDPHARPITNDDRRVLGEAAGGDGRKQIDDYCVLLIGPAPSPTTTAPKPGNPSPGNPGQGNPSPDTKPTHPVKPSHK